MQKVAVITGCNRGAGAGIRDILLKNEYRVIGINRTETKDIDDSNYTEVLVDVKNFSSVTSMYLPDGIDLLVLNAGVRRFDTIEDLDLQDWEDSVNTNLTGVFRVVKYLIDDVRKVNGDVVFIGSHSEKYTFEKGAAYCSTKGALKEFAECLMLEERYNDVRVSYLSLGSIKNRDHGGDESWKLKPEDVGQTVLNLVSLPKNIMIPYIDVRPAKPLRDSLLGIDRLQYL